MLDFFILASLVVIAFTASFFVLRAKIRKELSQERFLGEIAEEVARLVMDLNQSADRNVALLETRVEELKGLLDRADKGIVALRRELEALPARPSQIERRETSPRESPARQPNLPGIEIRRGDAESPRDEARSSVRRAVYGAAAYEAATGKLDAGTPTKAEKRPRQRTYIELEPDSKEEALALSRAGLSPEAIAKRIGKPVGEVELMIALGERFAGGN